MIGKIIKLIKIVAIAALATVALGYCGKIDTEYESQRELMLTKAPQIGVNNHE